MLASGHPVRIWYCLSRQTLYNTDMTIAAMPSSLLMTVGQDVDLFPMPSELTVAQAARIIDMSERRLNDILDAGHIAFQQKGNERLIHWDNLLQFKQWQKDTFATLEEMVRRDQEMGLYDD